MANIKSKAKRAITNGKRHEARKANAAELKTCIKNVLTAVDNKDKEAAVKAFDIANKKLDKAVVNHEKHRNYAARQKSRLANAINSLD